MTVKLATGTVTGTPRYLIFEDNQNGICEPYVLNLPDLLDEVFSLDAARIFLITQDHQISPVHIESTDGDPDYLHWEVILVDEGGELAERVEFDPEDPQNLDMANRDIYVDGFMP